jgi:hypothetical protein
MIFTFLHKFCKKISQSNKNFVCYIKMCADMQVGLQAVFGF